jgi:hypothetical protein
MECGIKIKCKKRFGQFLITGKPYIVFNDNEKIELKWNKEFFIALYPNFTYQVSVMFPYMSSTAGTVTFNVQVNPNEIQTYEYKTPNIMTSKGSITRKS